MAFNFRIQRHRNGGSLHLNLIGDFDGTSALELIHVLEAAAGLPGRVFVHTCCLSKVEPFGRNLLRTRLTRKMGKNLVFTGKFREMMTPAETPGCA